MQIGIAVSTAAAGFDSDDYRPIWHPIAE